MSLVRPFGRLTWLAPCAAAAPVRPRPASIAPARAQAAQAAQTPALSDSTKSGNVKSDGVTPPASQTIGAGNAASADQANPSAQKSLTTKAVEKVKQVAKSASDIFSRVPCLPPNGRPTSIASPPHSATNP